MVSERYSPGYFLYGLLIIIGLAFTGSGIFLTKTWYTQAIPFILTGFIASIWLIRIHNRTNDSIASFFDSLRNDDTAIQFPDRFSSRSLNTLYESMNRLNGHFQDIKMQSESNENYYKTLIRSSATGMLVLNQRNEIELMNETACMYAGISPETTRYKILADRNPEFYKAVCSMIPGENVTYKSARNNSFQLLFFRATLIRKNDQLLKLVSIQDIRQELESKEVESYRKLIRVLTHEIMNLLTPMTSVSKALFAQYHRNNQPIKLSDMDDNTIITTIRGLHVIEEQGRGMINFVNNYRKISKIPSPVIEAFSVAEWMEQLKIVFTSELESGHIDFEILADKAVRQIVADKKLINQVIINVMNNAIDAVKENEGNKKIEFHILPNFQNRVLIKISNNGPYIPPELQEKIFVPFFTTKKNGSGIGLSISQEIMKLHKGSLSVLSMPENHTVFVLEI
jgi:two-component system nitrogen regulation sensor histidine kinase NtrY